MDLNGICWLIQAWNTLLFYEMNDHWLRGTKSLRYFNMASKCKQLMHKLTCDRLIGTKEPGVESRDGIAHRCSQFSPCISIRACFLADETTHRQFQNIFSENTRHRCCIRKCWIDFSQNYTYIGNGKWRCFTLPQMPSDRRLKLKAEMSNYYFNYTK